MLGSTPCDGYVDSVSGQRETGPTISQAWPIIGKGMYYRCRALSTWKGVKPGDLTARRERQITK